MRLADDHYVLSREVLGPSYRAAFGLIAFVYLAEVRERGQIVLEDEGIRTHGTGNLTSLTNGVSHGCHRMLGPNVVRLANFVLAHRDHVVHGDTRTFYRRVVRHGGAFRSRSTRWDTASSSIRRSPSTSCPAVSTVDLSDQRRIRNDEHGRPRLPAHDRRALSQRSRAGRKYLRDLHPRRRAAELPQLRGAEERGSRRRALPLSSRRFCRYRGKSNVKCVPFPTADITTRCPP